MDILRSHYERHDLTNLPVDPECDSTSEKAVRTTYRLKSYDDRKNGRIIRSSLSLGEGSKR